MWKIIVDSIWGDDPGDETVWALVRDEDLANMRSFLKRHLRGDPSDYSIERGENHITIAYRSTGNTVLELRRSFN